MQPVQAKQHRLNRGDSMKKYDETLQLGKTTVHIVYPEPMSDETLEQRIKTFCLAAWEILGSGSEQETA